MLINFFLTLRKYKVPVTIRELMDVLAGLRLQLVYANVDDFYLFTRTAMVKDEKNCDKFDRAFSAYFKGFLRTCIKKEKNKVNMKPTTKPTTLYLSNKDPL